MQKVDPRPRRTRVSVRKLVRLREATNTRLSRFDRNGVSTLDHQSRHINRIGNRYLRFCTGACFENRNAAGRYLIFCKRLYRGELRPERIELLPRRLRVLMFCGCSLRDTSILLRHTARLMWLGKTVRTKVQEYQHHGHGSIVGLVRGGFFLA